MIKNFYKLKTFSVLLVGLLLSVSVLAETYQYDAQGKLIGVSYSDGSRISYRYDPAGNMLQVVNSAPNSNLDSDGDGVPDNIDVYPLVDIGSLEDSDGDGAPNICDQTCRATGMQADTDTADFVKRFYLQVLQRQADNLGLSTWVSELQSGAKTGADIAFGFIFSQEFTNRALGDGAYLDVLYRAFFDREPDDGGKNAWLSLMIGGTGRLAVLEGFTGSPEFTNLSDSFGIKPRRTQIELFVIRFYNQILLRQPDVAGLDDWTLQLNNKTKTGADIANGFVFSTEFINRKLSNQDYVLTLYRAFFGREGSVAESAGWVEQLDGGISRQSVLNGFLGAQEFTNLANSFGITGQ